MLTTAQITTPFLAKQFSDFMYVNDLLDADYLKRNPALLLPQPRKFERLPSKSEYFKSSANFKSIN